MEPSTQSQSLLPRFPAKRMTKDDFDNLSDQLIGAYWSMRITNPYPRTQGIKNIRIQLPPTSELVQPVAHSWESDGMPAGTTPPLQPTNAQPEPQPKLDVPKCFLHAKPKPSCPRCKAFLDAKREGISEPPEKRHRSDT